MTSADPKNYVAITAEIERLRALRTRVGGAERKRLSDRIAELERLATAAGRRQTPGVALRPEYVYTGDDSPGTE